MPPLDRRSFLRNLGLVTAAAWGGPRLLSTFTVLPAGAAATPGGTTLAATIVPAGASDGAAYTKLVDGPGWPAVVRTIGVEPQTGRESRREALASIVHLTDIHMVDAQSPARVEFLDRYNDPPTQAMPFSAAYRPQETLTAQVSESMIRRIAALAGGPQTGRAFDCAVCTGDNVDNQQRNEMEWHMRVLNGGGKLTPNSGNPAAYEGVMDNNATTYDQHYWHPESANPDFYKTQYGFPAWPGLLAASIGEFQATGLKMPWYTVYGNHDGLLQGNAPENPVFEAIAVSPLKVYNLPAGLSPADFFNGIAQQDPAVLTAWATAPGRTVTPDPKRAIVSSTEWIAEHRKPANAGPGPVGHGFTADNEATGRLYYTFAVAPGVTGISLDTVNRGGYADGSIGTIQRDWLAARLAEEKAAGRLVIIFSHHNLDTMGNPVPDPPTISAPDPQRVMGAAVEALLHQYGNVIAWVNGHSHVNRITPRPDPSGATGGFWEISTAAHVDWPQHARLVELANNKDGTLSIFCTLIEHAAPAATRVGATDVLGLAAISRELSFNDPHVNLGAAGEATDRNVELLLKMPAGVSFATSVASAGGSTAGDGGSRGDLAATGWSSSSLAFGAGAALLGGAMALRDRGRRAVDSSGEEA